MDVNSCMFYSMVCECVTEVSVYEKIEREGREILTYSFRLPQVTTTHNSTLPCIPNFQPTLRTSVFGPLDPKALKALDH